MFPSLPSRPGPLDLFRNALREREKREALDRKFAAAARIRTTARDLARLKDVPQLPPGEDQHQAALEAALQSIAQLIEQELAESEFGDVSWLAGTADSLIRWAQNEAAEYSAGGGMYP